ncbi:MAG: DNA recombination protein RmuC [Rhodospirillaceae bacterium]|nr:MAG: DNA recombination protein RmuC [Rhodospirillaceae bacterium]
MDVSGWILIGAALVVAVGAMAWALTRRAGGSGGGDLSRFADLATRLAESQANLGGRLSQMAESQQAAQTQLQSQLAERLQAQERAVTKMLDERLADVTRRVGENLQRTSEKSAETMSQLQERLAVIDAAQKNLTTLSEEVVSLQDILSNKQVRGAIGQTQMEDLVRNVLPPRAYDFQYALTNGKRADCVIHLPNPPGLICVDSKYPLEAYVALTEAEDERARTLAEAAFKTAVTKHITDIADKYIIPGETADQAIMFLPAESVFATLHDRFPALVQEGFRRRVFIVSPTTLMATLTTVRAILKDAQMREQAHVIQAEIGKLMEDVGRLDARVGKLATHFDQTRKDVDDVLTSTGKIIKRGEKIAEIQIDPPVVAIEAPAAAPTPLRQVGQG